MTTETPDRNVISAGHPPTPDRRFFTGLSSNQLAIAFVTGVSIVAAAGVTGYFTRPVPQVVESSVAPDTGQASQLQAQIDDLKAENQSLRSKLEVQPQSEDQKQVPKFVIESFAIPNGKFMGFGNHRFIVTVDSIEFGVGDLSIRDVRDMDNLTDRKFAAKGSTFRLKSENLLCTLSITDVMNSSINFTTECTE